MAFDASPPPQSDSPQTVGGTQRRRWPSLSLGVFNYDGEWKVYSQFEPALACTSRDQAVVAAETRAFEAVRCGQKVELFVQDENGELRQAAIAPQ